MRDRRRPRRHQANSVEDSEEQNLEEPIREARSTFKRRVTCIIISLSRHRNRASRARNGDYLGLAADTDLTDLMTIVISILVVIFFSLAAMPSFAQHSKPTSPPKSDVRSRTNAPTISILRPSKPPDGCGCNLQFPTDYRKHNDRYVFLSDLVDSTGKMNIDGRNVELTMLRDEETKGNMRVGDRFFQTYGLENLRVRIDYTVTRICNPSDEGCEVTWYSAAITVTRGGSSQRARVLGVCGC